MIKCNNGTIEISGEKVIIIGDICHVILKLKELLKDDKIHFNLLNEELLCCVQSNNSNEYLKYKFPNKKKILNTLDKIERCKNC